MIEIPIRTKCNHARAVCTILRTPDIRTCPDCGGSGYIARWMPLEQAIIDAHAEAAAGIPIPGVTVH